MCVRVVACRIKTEEKDARVRVTLYKAEAVGREPVSCHVPDSLAGGLLGALESAKALRQAEESSVFDFISFAGQVGTGNVEVEDFPAVGGRNNEEQTDTVKGDSRRPGVDGRRQQARIPDATEIYGPAWAGWWRRAKGERFRGYGWRRANERGGGELKRASACASRSRRIGSELEYVIRQSSNPE